MRSVFMSGAPSTEDVMSRSRLRMLAVAALLAAVFGASDFAVAVAPVCVAK